jgi:predicted HAD superfamily Cof-like phosphohydrolase
MSFKKSHHQLRVEDFMRLAGQEVPEIVGIPDEKTRELRARLILEEALETVEALGFLHYSKIDRSVENYLQNCQRQEPDLEKVIDGCSDLKVVVTGTLSAFGVPDKAFQEEVDSNNLKKFGPGGYRRDDGKWVKPPDHQPPQIAKMVEELRRSR